MWVLKAENGSFLYQQGALFEPMLFYYTRHYIWSHLYGKSWHTRYEFSCVIIQLGQLKQIRCDMTVSIAKVTLKAPTPFACIVVKGYERSHGQFCLFWPSNTQWQLRFDYLHAQCGIYLDIFLLVKTTQWECSPVYRLYLKLLNSIIKQNIPSLINVYPLKASLTLIV